jgi:hypothetical protein
MGCRAFGAIDAEASNGPFKHASSCKTQILLGGFKPFRQQGIEGDNDE